jgi:ribosomal protein S18 acetylase RimI-like enzyme
LKGIPLSTLSLQIRNAEKDEMALIESMSLSLYKEDPSLRPMKEEKIKKTIAEAMENPEKLNIVVFLEEKEVIGYALLVFYWSNEWGGNIVYIDELYILPKARGHGIARQFMKWLFVQYSGKAAAFKLEVTANNQKAKKFYESVGFKTSSNEQMILELPS